MQRAQGKSPVLGYACLGVEFYSRPDGFLASAPFCPTLLWWTPWTNQPWAERVYSILQEGSQKRNSQQVLESRNHRGALLAKAGSPGLLSGLSNQPRTTGIAPPTVGWVSLHQSSIKTYPVINLMELSPPLRAPLPSWVKLTTHAYSDSILQGNAPAISRQEWPAK